MTPEDVRYRDAWLDEMWQVCPGPDRVRVVSGPNCKGCGRQLEKVGKRGRPRQFCPACRPAQKGR